MGKVEIFKENVMTNSTLTPLAGYARALSWGPSWAETIAHAVEHGYLLGRYADPIDNGAEDIDSDEAEAVAAEDPSLVYVYRQDDTMNRTAAAIAALDPSTCWDIYVGQQDPAEFAPAVEQEIRDYTRHSPLTADLDSAARAALAAQLTSYALAVLALCEEAR